MLVHVECYEKVKALLSTSIEDAKSTICFVSMEVLEVTLRVAELEERKSLIKVLRTEIRQRNLGKRVQL
jgi:hypothetical protein